MEQIGFNLDLARRETPGCENVLHFNNAGAALMPLPVIRALTDHLQLEAEIGGYEAAIKAADRIEHVYDAVSRLLNCERDEVAIIENATRAWDMAFYSIPFQPGDRILTAKAEYASNYIAFIQMMKRTGVVIEVIPNDKYGQISLNALQSMIDKRVRLIAITHVPTGNGLVNPAAEVGKIAREAGILYLLDACQSAGQLPLDVQAIGCDFLSATGRKYLRGPRGTGFLYVRRDRIEQLIPPLLDLRAAEWVGDNQITIRADARRFENWETYYAGKIALGVAIDYALTWGVDRLWQRIHTLAGALRTGLSRIPGVQIHDTGEVQCGIVTFTAEGKTPTHIKDHLNHQNINSWVSGLTSSRLDMEARGLESVVRASVHYYNAEAEIERFCEAVEGAIQYR
jgi:cysteine desulfurase/selenocysteine lyase